MTPEEYEKALAKANATIETLKGDVAAKDTKIGELTTNLTNQRKTLEGERDTAIKERDEANGKVTEFTEKGQKELTEYQEKRIEAMSKGDKAIADKIRAEYGNLNMPEDTREGIDNRALKAFQLATAVSANPLATQTNGLDTDMSKNEPAGKMGAEEQAVFDRMFGGEPGSTTAPATTTNQ